MKKALITGVTGQDGSYLAKTLLNKGYVVIGISRQTAPNLSNLKYLKIEEKVEIHTCDTLDQAVYTKILQEIHPDEIYNLAGESSVTKAATSNIIEEKTKLVTIILEYIKTHAPATKLFHAASSEMYGKEVELPIHEETARNPSTTYGAAHVAAFEIVSKYRSEGFFCVNGILFTHESHLRAPTFFIKRVLRTAISISYGKDDSISIGQSENKRDFGYSPDYVEAMWLSLQHQKPQDYIISSGTSVSIQEICHYILQKFKIPNDRIKIDSRLIRKDEAREIYGDNSRIKNELDWKYEKSFFDVLDILIKEECQLSIIIPCYNCESTLEQSFLSCLNQNLDIPYEIVMVDDCSTDDTLKIIKKLAAKYPNVQYVQQQKNSGGGATRNNAVRHAQSDLIFCLDSDDILPDSTLPKMLKLLKERKCDGVFFEETRFFSKTPGKQEQSIKNAYTDSPIRLSSMFMKDVGFQARVNFLYTRDAHTMAGGYPEHHGFDTQTFGFRFLTKGLKGFICPETFYYHRRNEGASYFDRESRSGKLSFNTYLMYEDFFFLFSKEVQEKILNFDIFTYTSLGHENLEQSIVEEFQNLGERNFFIPEYEKYLTPENDRSFNDPFILALRAYKKKEFGEAIKGFTSLLRTYPESKILLLDIERARLQLENTLLPGKAEKISHQKFYTKPNNLAIRNLLRRFCRKLKHIFF